MNKQQIIERLASTIADSKRIEELQCGVLRFIADLAMDGLTEGRTYSGRFFSAELRQEIIVRDHFTCVYCNRPGSTDRDPDGEMWAVDHVIPHSKGGTTCIDNGVLSCWKCNSEKGDMTPAQFIKRLRFSKLATPINDIYEDESVFEENNSGRADLYEITTDMLTAYNTDRWQGFCPLLFSSYPEIVQSDLRQVMAKITGKPENSFKGEAFRYYHRFSPNGDKTKIKGYMEIAA